MIFTLPPFFLYRIPLHIISELNAVVKHLLGLPIKVVLNLNKGCVKISVYGTMIAAQSSYRGYGSFSPAVPAEPKKMPHYTM